MSDQDDQQYLFGQGTDQDTPARKRVRGLIKEWNERYHAASGTNSKEKGRIVNNIINAIGEANFLHKESDGTITNISRTRIRKELQTKFSHQKGRTTRPEQPHVVVPEQQAPFCQARLEVELLETALHAATRRQETARRDEFERYQAAQRVTDIALNATGNPGYNERKTAAETTLGNVDPVSGYQLAETQAQQMPQPPMNIQHGGVASMPKEGEAPHERIAGPPDGEDTDWIPNDMGFIFKNEKCKGADSDNTVPGAEEASQQSSSPSTKKKGSGVQDICSSPNNGSVATPERTPAQIPPVAPNHLPPLGAPGPLVAPRESSPDSVPRPHAPPAPIARPQAPIHTHQILPSAAPLFPPHEAPVAPYSIRAPSQPRIQVHSRLPRTLPLRNCRVESTRLRVHLQGGTRYFVGELECMCYTCGEEFPVSTYVNVIECPCHSSQKGPSNHAGTTSAGEQGGSGGYGSPGWDGFAGQGGSGGYPPPSGSHRGGSSFYNSPRGNYGTRGGPPYGRLALDQCDFPNDDADVKLESADAPYLKPDELQSSITDVALPLKKSASSNDITSKVQGLHWNDFSEPIPQQMREAPASISSLSSSSTFNEGVSHSSKKEVDPAKRHLSAMRLSETDAIGETTKKLKVQHAVLVGAQEAALDSLEEPGTNKLHQGDTADGMRIPRAIHGKYKDFLTLKEHSDDINCCAMWNDGRNLLSGSEDKTLKVWERQSDDQYDCIQTLEGRSYVYCCTVWNDGGNLLSGHGAKYMKVWERKSDGQYHCTQTIRGHSNTVSCCAVLNDGRHLLSGSYDRTLKVWQRQSYGQYHCIQTLQGHSNWVFCCAVWNDGRHLLSGSWDKTLKVWERQSDGQYQCIQTHQEHSRSVDCCAVWNDGRHLLSGSCDHTLKVWERQSDGQYQCIQTLQGHSSHVLCCAVWNDGRHLLSGSYDKTLRVWERQSDGQYHCIQTLQGHSSFVYSCAVSYNGQLLVSGSSDDTLKVWKLGADEADEERNALGESSYQQVAEG